MVERRDRDDHAEQRVALRVDAALPAVGRDVAGEDLAVVAQRRLRREAEHVAHPADLVARILHAQARFERDQRREFVLARNHQGAGALEDGRPIRPRQRRTVAPSGLERLARVVDTGLRHRARHLARPRVADLDRAAVARDAATADTQGFVLEGETGHGPILGRGCGRHPRVTERSRRCHWRR
jgi:hypothetical protein